MSDLDLVPLARVISRLLGWSYVFCWSASFYGQPLLNWRRRSTIGLAVDFPYINVLGFVSYAISTTSFLYSPLIRDQYAVRNPSSPEPTVRFNDLAFALHAVVLSAITYSQFCCWGFKTERGQRVSRPIAGIFWGSLVGVWMVIMVVMMYGLDGGRDARGWAWIDVIYAIGYVKLLVTVVKFVPQVWTNHRRRSTVGWNIDQVLLDFAGGVLSLMQLLLDSSLQKDWSRGILGNPIKFGLGNVSIFFDVIFIAQHYYLYPPSSFSMTTTTAAAAAAAAAKAKRSDASKPVHHIDEHADDVDDDDDSHHLSSSISPLLTAV